MIFGTILKRRSASILALFGPLMCVEIDGSPAATELIAPWVDRQNLASSTEINAISKKMMGSECSGNDDCESRSCFRRNLSEQGLCQCQPCFSSGCGGCPAKHSCQFRGNIPFCKIKTEHPRNNPIYNLSFEMPMEKPKEKLTIMQTEILANSIVTTQLTVGKNLLDSECSFDDDCISGSCFRLMNSIQPLCKCNPCSTAGCGGCPMSKICQLSEDGKYPRCETHYQVTTGHLRGESTKESVTRMVSGLERMSFTKRFTTEVETLEIGEGCLRDDDCLSGSCFKLAWAVQGRCQCKSCTTAGCSGCSATTNCQVVHAYAPNNCLPYVPLPTSEMPSKAHSNVPSIVSSDVPSYSPTTSASSAPVFNCFGNGQCEEGLVCDTEHLCREIACWRDNDCTKFDAYCNKMDICGKKKEMGAICQDSRECRIGNCDKNKCQFLSDAPSLSPTALSSLSLIGLGGSTSRDTIRNGVSWYNELSSDMRLGVSVVTCVVTLAVLATVYCIISGLLLCMSWNSPKGDDSSTSSKFSCTPLSSNNSFSCPRPQSPACSVLSKGGNKSTQYSTPRRSDRSLSSRPQSPTWSVSSKGGDKSTQYSISRRSDRSMPSLVSPTRSVSSRDDNQSIQSNRVRSLPLNSRQSHLSHTQSQESPGRNVSRKGDDRPNQSRNQMSGISSRASPYMSSQDYSARPLSPAWSVASVGGEKSSFSRYPHRVRSLPSSQGRAHQSNHTYPEKSDRIVSSKDSNKSNQSNRPKWGMPRLVKTDRSLQHHQHTSTTLPRSRTEPKRGGTYI